MKTIERISAPNGRLSVTLSFNCEAIMILNPTAYTLLVRTGGLDAPSEQATADFLVPGGNMITYPAFGIDFGFGFATPKLSFTPEGMPTQAQIIFIAQEPLPVFGSVTTQSETMPAIYIPSMYSASWGNTANGTTVTRCIVNGDDNVFRRLVYYETGLFGAAASNTVSCGVIIARISPALDIMRLGFLREINGTLQTKSETVDIRIPGNHSVRYFFQNGSGGNANNFGGFLVEERA